MAQIVDAWLKTKETRLHSYHRIGAMSISMFDTSRVA